MAKEDAKVVVDFYDFTKDDYEYLVNKCMLNEELSKILELKIKGESNIKIADTLNISDATLSRRIRLLKKKIKRVL